jgi:SAM-dependent methyltransferase
MYVRMIGGVTKTTYCEQVTIGSVKPVLRTDMFVADGYERELFLADQMALPVKQVKDDLLKDESFDFVRAVQGVIVKETVVAVDSNLRMVVSPKEQEVEGEVLEFGFVDEGLSVRQLEAKFVPLCDRNEEYYLKLEDVNYWSKKSDSANECIQFELVHGARRDESFVDDSTELVEFDSNCSLDEYIPSTNFVSSYNALEPRSCVLGGEASRAVRCTRCFKELPMSFWKIGNVSKILCYDCLNSKRFRRNPGLLVRCSDCSVKLIISTNCTLRQFSKKHPRCSACVDSQLRDYCLPSLDYSKVNFDFCSGDFCIDVDSRPVIGLSWSQVNIFRQYRFLQFNSLLKLVGFQIPESQKIDFIFSKTINELVQFVWEHKHFWMQDSSLVNWLKALGPGYARWGDGPSNYSELVKRIEGAPGSILDYGCGSGHGVSQIKKGFPFAECRGYDVEDLVDSDLDVICETVISSQYDVVVLNNVLHHVVDLDVVYDDFVKLVGPCTQVLVKDHCATNENLFLLVLVHVCYLGGEIERMVFRSPSVIEDFFSNFGIVCTTSFLGNVYNDVLLNFSVDL